MFSGEGITALESLLAGDEGVFREPPTSTLAPYILKRDNLFNRIGDAEEIVTVQDPVEVVLAFAMLHSVLNLKFGRRSPSFGLFTQIILGKDDGANMSLKALTLLRRLD